MGVPREGMGVPREGMGVPPSTISNTKCSPCLRIHTSSGFAVLFVDCSKGWSFNTWAGTEFNTDLFSIVQAAPIIMFAFTCQVNVFSIYDELEKPVSICRHHLSNCLVVQGNRVERGGGGYKYNFSRVLICNFFFFSRQHCNSRTAKCQK